MTMNYMTNRFLARYLLFSKDIHVTFKNITLYGLGLLKNSNFYKLFIHAFMGCDEPELPAGCVSALPAIFLVHLYLIV